MQSKATVKQQAIFWKYSDVKPRNTSHWQQQQSWIGASVAAAPLCHNKHWQSQLFICFRVKETAHAKLFHREDEICAAEAQADRLPAWVLVNQQTSAARHCCKKQSSTHASTVVAQSHCNKDLIIKIGCIGHKPIDCQNYVNRL